MPNCNYYNLAPKFTRANVSIPQVHIFEQFKCVSSIENCSITLWIARFINLGYCGKISNEFILFFLCYSMLRVSIIPHVAHETFKPMRNEHGCHEIGRRVICAFVMVMDRKTNVKANRILYFAYFVEGYSR